MRNLRPFTNWPTLQSTLLAGLILLTACTTPSPMTPTLTSAPTLEPTPTVQPTNIPTLNNLIPQPVSVTAGSGAFNLTSATIIQVDPNNPELTKVGQYLAAVLQPATGFTLAVSTANSSVVSGSINLTLTTGDPSWRAEGYRLTVSPTQVTVEAAQPQGIFYGLQTLKQLLPPAIESNTLQPGPWLIPTAVITDQPRFEWRGFMLDVARHFFGVPEVKRYIDFMAAYKLNRLHLHLSDDQGWRLEIKSWPKLATFGGSTAVDEDPGGYYTQADYSEIVAYAQSRYITVIPEIDLPGHTNAALASYPELNCNGDAPALYTGTQVGFSSLCMDKDVTYKFLDDVFGEIAAITPGPYIHVGGDEAQATVFVNYQKIIEHVQATLHTHGKQMIGWEEISQVPNLLPGTLAQHWSSDLAQLAVKQGLKVIMSPATKAYLDMKYDAHTYIGQDWAAFISEESGYNWDPATQALGITEKDIAGVEAPLWTETVNSQEKLDYLAFPRLLGYAEMAWSPQASRSWDNYKDRLAQFGPRFEAAGIQFYKSSYVPWP